MSEPLLFFVHVPKTAGSSVNSALKATGLNGGAHVESIIGTQEGLNTIAGWDWASGHVSFDVSQRRLETIGRQIRYFSCMRDPLSQVISHVNWLIEIQNKGDAFFFGHPAEIRKISYRAKTVDFRNPNSVILFMLESPGLFLNCQSAFIVGKDHKNLNLNQISERISRYSYIGRSETLSNLLESMGISKVNSIVPRENVSRKHFDTEVFYSPEMARALKHYNSSDISLYEMISDFDVKNLWPVRKGLQNSNQ